jgi:hypothetical protein
MGLFYWGINQGQTEFSVVTGTSDPSKNIEVTVDLTKVYGNATYPTGIRKDEMVRALEMITAEIVKGNWPPHT